MTLTVKHVCLQYGVSEHTVLGWIHSGELQAVNVGRRPGSKKPRWRITQQALQSFEAQRMAAPLPPQPKKRRKQRLAGVIEFYK